MSDYYNIIDSAEKRAREKVCCRDDSRDARKGLLKVAQKDMLKDVLKVVWKA